MMGTLMVEMDAPNNARLKTIIYVRKISGTMEHLYVHTGKK